jgi:NAD(P)-dependent dehydrogenase (short-subunit alcohol dehydrogenase family)
MRNILITGANRGIGFELTRLFAVQTDTKVFAACRGPEKAVALRELAEKQDYNIEIIKLDVGDEESISSCAKQMADRVDSLWALINNAGIYGGSVSDPAPETSRFGLLDMEAMLRIFRTNTIAPVLLSQKLFPLLSRSSSPRIINISSDAGSISMRKSKGNFSYQSSKAGLNMMTRNLAEELREKGCIVVSVHPGFLKTDMGGPGAPLTVDDTIPGLKALIEGLTMQDTSKFINWDGTPIPW